MRWKLHVRFGERAGETDQQETLAPRPGPTQPHFTPPHASWVNQVEMFFSILQRKVIRNGNFTSRGSPSSPTTTRTPSRSNGPTPPTPSPHDPHATYFSRQH